MRSVLASACALALVIVALESPAVDAQEDPLRWLPPDSNTVAVVRVGELLNSKLGQRRDWVDEYQDAYAIGAVSAPPSVLTVYRATEYRPYAHSQQPVYSVYAMRVDVRMNEIAQHELTEPEKIGDTFVVPTTRGVYFVRLGQKLLGALEPPDRQLLSRWLRYGAQTTKPQLSEYLVRAATDRQSGQVLVAVDLTDMAQPEHVSRWLAASPAVRALGGDLEELTEQLASLQGLRLSVEVTDEIVGRLRLDFARPVDTRPEVLKALVLEWLDESGAHLESLVHADASIDGNTFMLQTRLEEQGFRRILTLIQTQHPLEAGDLSAKEREPNAIASRRYYKGVVAAVNDLSAKNRKAADYQKTALWHENQAQRIENLSTANVDADLSAWGYDVAQKLRALASSLRGVPVTVNQLERSIRYDVRSYDRRIATTEWGAFFRPEWLQVDTNLQEVRAAQRLAIAENQAEREQIWTMLEEDRQAIVKKMEEKYKVEFEK